jgi:hypothetical protein
LTAATTTKVDLFREHRDEYAMATAPTLLRTGPGRYLTVSGSGSPEGDEFKRKLGALYGSAYTIKFARKKRRQDFKVGMLEGLWWTKGGGSDFLSASKDEWRWKLLIRVPEFVTARDLADALVALRAKRGAVEDVRLETLREGRVVQMLHVGAYADEPRSIDAMDEFVRAKRMHYRGAHHEIYLSDPRRVPPSRLRTILRHPVA